MVSTINLILVSVFGSVLALSLWQHIAVQGGLSFRPADAIDAGAARLEAAYTALGAWWAWVSSFIEHLHIDQFAVAMGQVLRPLWRALWSFRFAAQGYWTYVAKHHSSIIVAGSGVLAAAIFWVAYSWRDAIFGALRLDALYSRAIAPILAHVRAYMAAVTASAGAAAKDAYPAPVVASRRSTRSSLD